MRKARPKTSPQGIAVRQLMHPEFRISHRDETGWTVVEIHGEVDVSSVPQVREHVFTCIEVGRYRLIVDLRGVPYIDSTGLGVLVSIAKRIRTHVGDLKLVITNPDILQIFRITGLHRVLQISDSVEAAME
ncbi:STAS domain-containing protein [Streptomyces sp. NBC_01003]|uniref:STAS domain-containing protein n=1 Tax=Streptomyces sp. NBC_01003 TaxID=2903714 RepID=UPI0038651F74